MDGQTWIVGIMALSLTKMLRALICGKPTLPLLLTHPDELKKYWSRKRKGIKKSKAMSAKLSKTTTGRKRLIKPDGSWTWMYPEDRH